MLQTQMHRLSFFFFFFRGDHLGPNFEEIWPSKKGKNSAPKRGLEYYYDAMTNGPELSGDFTNSQNFCCLSVCENMLSHLYLVQLIKQPILRIPNFNFPNLRCCKVFWSFWYKESYMPFVGVLWYCDLVKHSKSKYAKNSLQKFGTRNCLFDDLNEI